MSDFLREFPDEGSQNKEIYARFGLAAYLASVFEEGVAIAITMQQLLSDLRERRITTKLEWEKRHDEEMARAHKSPLGPALGRLYSLLQVSSQTKELFSEALKKRNYLIHHFYRDEIHEFYTRQGRARIHAKLVSYVDLFSRADRELTAVTAPQRQKVGLTDHKLQQALEELEAEYRGGSH